MSCNYFTENTWSVCFIYFDACPRNYKIYYRPKRKFAKVMFLHVSVCPQGGVPPWDQVHPPGGTWSRGVHPGTPPDQVQGRYTPLHRYTPRDQVHLPGPGTPRTRYTARDQVHPPGTRYTTHRYLVWGVHPGTQPPEQVHPPDQVHPHWAGTPPDQVHPPGPGTSPGPGTPRGARYTPRAVHAGRYGQQAGGTHPTGMHSCLVWPYIVVNCKKVKILFILNFVEKCSTCPYIVKDKFTLIWTYYDIVINQQKFYANRNYCVFGAISHFEFR